MNSVYQKAAKPLLSRETQIQHLDLKMDSKFVMWYVFRESDRFFSDHFVSFSNEISWNSLKRFHRDRTF